LADTVDPFVKAAHFMISARNDISFRLCNINKLVNHSVEKSGSDIQLDEFKIPRGRNSNDDS
jgi:hypothetical protein